MQQLVVACSNSISSLPAEFLDQRKWKLFLKALLRLPPARKSLSAGTKVGADSSANRSGAGMWWDNGVMGPGRERRSGEQRAEHPGAYSSLSSKPFDPPTPKLSSTTSKSPCLELLRAGVGSNSVQHAISQGDSAGVHMVSHAGSSKGAAELIRTMHLKGKALFWLSLCCAVLTEGAH